MYTLSTETTKGRLIQFKQGERKSLPKLKVGEPAFCTDDVTFWIGSNNGNKQIAMIDDISSASIDDGSVSFAKLNQDLQDQITSFITLNQIPIATDKVNGLMSTAMVDKLDTIEVGANKTVIVNDLTSTDENAVLSAYQGKVLKELFEQGGGSGATVPDGTTTTKGIVKLSSAINSTSELEAATPKAVKEAYDLAKNAMDKPSSIANVYQQDITTTSTSTGFGYKNKVTGEFSIATGYNGQVAGNFANSMNFETNAYGEASTSMGDNTKSGTYASVAIGRYNKDLNGSAFSYSATSDVFVIGNGNPSDNVKSNAIRMTFGGAIYGLSAFNSSGADYAEFFEWLDGNLDNEDRRGYVVTLDGDKIRKATMQDEYILGVVSSQPSVIGDSHQDDWSGKYMRDVWGKLITEDIINDGGEVETVPCYNPEWNPTEEYIPREKRKEWSPIGLMGKLLVRDNGKCEPNDFVKVGANDGVLVKSEEPTNMRVMKRVTDEIVQVFIK